MSKGKLSVQTENEISKLRQENAYLKRMLDDLSRQKGEPSDSENNKLLLERILSLETLREKNSQQILARDQEIDCLRQQLQPDNAETVANLQAQLKEQREDAEVRERLFQSLKQETDQLKDKLAALSAKCQDLKNREHQSDNEDGNTVSRNAAVIQSHLKDALEKNQQWLVYDQQREAYVRTVLSKCHQLEQQLNQTEETLRLKEKEGERAVEMQQYYEKLVVKLKKGLDATQQLLAEHRIVVEEEERLRSAEHREQIQVSAKDLEEEKHDNQHLQWQLHKILRELRKANDRVARLESEKAHRETASSEVKAFSKEEKSSRENPKSFSSSARANNVLDESFLECPNCRAQCPTSRHRKLLVHIDEYFD